MRNRFLHIICAFCAVLVFQGCSSQLSDTNAGALRSKYDELLPATDFKHEVSSRAPDVKADPNLSREPEAPLSLNDQVDRGKSETSELRVKPVLLLDHSYTVRIGYFGSSAEASAFVSAHNLDSNESGIAKVGVDGEEKHLLAYGVFSDKTLAENVAEQMAKELDRSLEVVSLAAIEAAAGSTDSSTDSSAENPTEITTY